MKPNPLYDSSKSRGPPPSLNHNSTLSDMPTFHLLRLLSVGSFFHWNASLPTFHLLRLLSVGSFFHWNVSQKRKELQKIWFQLLGKCQKKSLHVLNEQNGVVHLIYRQEIYPVEVSADGNCLPNTGSIFHFEIKTNQLKWEWR